jgi:hypothetical protein
MVLAQCLATTQCHHEDGGSKPIERRSIMAKGQTRSNKEVKKPKATAKTKSPTAAGEPTPKASVKFGKKGLSK